MLSPLDIKLSGTLSDFSFLVKAFEAVHKCVASQTPLFDRNHEERYFNVTITLADSKSSFSVSPVSDSEDN